MRRWLVFACLFVCATSAFADTRSWTGAVNDLWSVGGNWSGGVAPVSGDALVFPAGALNTNNSNDLAGLTLVSIAFPAGGYTIGGNAITLTGGMTNVCCNLVTWNIPTTLGASQTFDADGVTVFSSTIALGGHTLTILPYTTTVSGSITGTGNVVVTDSHGVNLTGSIAIAGNVTVSTGARLNVDGSLSATSLVMGAGTILSGDGTIPSTALNGATTRVGNDPGAGCCADPHSLGILTTGNVSATGGTVAFDLVTTTPGTGHDQLAVNGSVTLSNPGLEVSFPSTLPAAGTSFVIIANDGVDAVSGTFSGRPEGSTFAAGSTTLQITYAGGSGNDVVLTVLASPKAWTGAVNNLWSVGGNWNGGVAPVNGDALVFPPGALNTNNSNDLAGLTVASISFPAGGYTIGGNAITLTGGMTNVCCNLVTWNIPTTLGASQTFDADGVTVFSSTIALGGHTLTILPYTTTVSGSIAGTGNVIVSGGHGVNLTGSIAIAGNVTVSPGSKLNVDGSISATSLALGVGAILSGDGTIPSTALNGATTRVGNDPGAGCCADPHSLGILTTGNLSATGGTMAFDLVTNTPGTGHDQLAVNGSVTLSNPGLEVSFPSTLPAAGASFVIVNNDGADAVSGTFSGRPEGSTFATGSTTLQITYTGGSGNDVVLTVLASSKAWTGAVNNLWSVGGNWNGGVAPVNGDALVFPAGALNTNNSNNLAGLTVASISFPAGGYTIGGNAITLTGGMTNVCCNLVTWNIPTTLGASQTFDADGVTVFSSTIALGGHTLTILPYTTTVSGSIAGTGNVIVSGGHGVNLTGSIAIAGNVTVSPGSKLNVDGSISATSLVLGVGAILSGDGTIPSTVLNGAVTRVGNDPGAGCCADPHSLGILTTGNVSATGGTMAFDLVTTTPGTGHDQLAVNGTVTLSNPGLQVSFPSILPAAGTSFVIIANDGADAVSGTFVGRPEGSAFAAGSTMLRITYAGGTGNDVVLTALQETTTTLASSQNPTEAGETFTLTAHVTSSAGIPGGTVSFEEGATVLGTATLNASGDATLSLALPAGAHSIVARYVSAGAFAPSTSVPLTQNVIPAETTTTLESSRNPTQSGEPFTLTAHVTSPFGVPNGTVFFEEGSTVLGTATLDASGHATLSLALPTGVHEIVARYAGAADFAPSTSAPLAQSVNAADIPTLSTWMLLLFAAAMAVIGLRMGGH